MLVEIKNIHSELLTGPITMKAEKQNWWLKQNVQKHSSKGCSVNFFLFNCLLVSTMSYAFCSPQKNHLLLKRGVVQSFKGI